jgi:hypothetical protein
MVTALEEVDKVFDFRDFFLWERADFVEEILFSERVSHEHSILQDVAIKASALRENLDRILDEVLDTGEPVEIEHRGKILRIVPLEARSKLDNLRPRHHLLTDPEELIHLDWIERTPE